MRNYKPYNEDKMNTYGKIYKWEVACCLGRATFTFDGKELGHADLNPIGTGGDYICYPQLGNTGQEAAPTGQMTYARRHPHPARPRAKGNRRRYPSLQHKACRKAIKRRSRQYQACKIMEKVSKSPSPWYWISCNPNRFAWHQGKAPACPYLAKSPSNTYRKRCSQRKTATYRTRNVYVKYFSSPKKWFKTSMKYSG